MSDRQNTVTEIPAAPGTLLSRMLDAAVQDRQTVTAEGKETSPMIEGVRFRELPTHSDERGSVTEMYSTAWNWHPDPTRVRVLLHHQARNGEGMESPQAARGSLLHPAG